MAPPCRYPNINLYAIIWKKHLFSEPRLPMSGHNPSAPDTINADPTKNIQQKLGEDLVRMIRTMKLIAAANLAFGLLNAGVYFATRPPESDLLVTGLLSISIYFLVKMKISFINSSKSWIELSITSACGLYLPIFVLAITLFKLIQPLLF